MRVYYSLRFDGSKAVSTADSLTGATPPVTVELDASADGRNSLKENGRVFNQVLFDAWSAGLPLSTPMRPRTRCSSRRSSSRFTWWSTRCRARRTSRSRRKSRAITSASF